jgi:hypothetical protein
MFEHLYKQININDMLNKVIRKSNFITSSLNKYWFLNYISLLIIKFEHNKVIIQFEIILDK